ncbi:hypothetical protein IFR05_015407 [Cadophora sp. M221]|nr:hypothetical protein IFR05_015407 [Cadophora sp. M221]
MAHLKLTQGDIDRLVPHLHLVLDMLANLDDYQTPRAKDFNGHDQEMGSNTETEVDTEDNSVFDSVGDRSVSSETTEHAPQSLLMDCQLYISASSAAQNGLQRKDSLAALRFHSVCDQPLCQDWIPDSIKRCECMTILTGDRRASDTEVWGFFHCRECLEYAHLGLDMQNTRLVTFQTDMGDEVLAVSIIHL